MRYCTWQFGKFQDYLFDPENDSLNTKKKHFIGFVRQLSNRYNVGFTKTAIVELYNHLNNLKKQLNIINLLSRT